MTKKSTINLLCRLLGHRWEAQYMRHDHFYRLSCRRCGRRAAKKRNSR